MRRPTLIGITRILALAACTDFAFVDDEAKWRGSEVHRIVELATRGTLDRRSVPPELAGYAEARHKFARETNFIADPKCIERKVQNLTLGIRGRIDCAGLMRGRPCVADYKSGQIGPAVGLQLCLGGHLLDPDVWWDRIAVRLHKDGSYSLKTYDRKTWHSDLSTALAASRIARWKLQNNLA